MKKSLILTISFVLCSLLLADPFTPVPGFVYDKDGEVKRINGSTIQTQLRIKLEEGTDKLHLISTNNDPDIITKTYILKHADPYEIRPFLMAAVRAERISGDATKIECIKYNDGTGAVIISAEDYRFEDQEEGMGFDELIKILDQPKITSGAGTDTYIYLPQFRSSSSLSNIVWNVGLNHSDDETELQGGEDRMYTDEQLNAMLFYTPAYNRKNIERVISLYDKPLPEVKIKYSIYELVSENDGKIGMDFQAWKNGPGADIFSAAGRFSKGWTGDVASGVINGTKWNSTKFIKFSPRWNTRYLDFLAAKGKARVITTGKISVMNQKQGYLTAQTVIPRFADGAKLANLNVNSDYFTLENQNFHQDNVAAGANNVDDYQIVATDSKGKLITTSGFNGSMSFTRLNYGGVETYEIRIMKGNGTIYRDGKPVGTQQKCFNLTINQCTEESTIVGVDPNTGGTVTDNVYSWTPIEEWRTDKRMTIYRGRARETVGQSYGFEMTLAPVVCEDKTILAINMVNTSLIGFASDGTARTAESKIVTQVLINNQNQSFVIGGLEKRSLVRSVSKLPWLGSIPVIGWFLSSESESTKKTQLVAVLECQLASPGDQISAEEIQEIDHVDKKLKNAGETNDFKDNNYGFDQFLFDKSKKSLDPLP